MNQVKNRKYRLLTILFIVLFVCSIANISLATETYKTFAEKVKNNEVIEISNEQELRWLATYTNNGETTKGKTFNIINNINVDNSREWQPIGNNYKPFRGTLNGNGYTISGITVSEKKSYVGLVGYNEGIIKNVTIGQCFINIPPDVTSDINDLLENGYTSYGYIGGVAGYNIGKIYNCINNSNIIASCNVGGIAGANEGKSGDGALIQNCVNNGSIIGYQSIGGIVGLNTGKGKISGDISCSINSGNVYGEFAHVGGIAGRVRGAAGINHSTNKGTISSARNEITVKINGKDTKLKPENVGGLAGLLGASKKIDSEENMWEQNDIQTSLNEGAIYGYLDVGGLVGQFGTETGESKIEKCVNKGTIIETEDLNERGEIAGQIGNVDQDDTSSYTEDVYYFGKNEAFGQTKGFIQEINPVTKVNDDNKGTVDLLIQQCEEEKFNPQRIESIQIYTKNNGAYNLAKNNGSYNVGDTIYITVELNKSFTVANNPTLKISINGKESNAEYFSKTHNSITYKYDIKSEDIGEIALSSFEGSILNSDKAEIKISTSLEEGIVVEELYNSKKYKETFDMNNIEIGIRSPEIIYTITKNANKIEINNIVGLQTKPEKIRLYFYDKLPNGELVENTRTNIYTITEDSFVYTANSAERGIVGVEFLNSANDSLLKQVTNINLGDITPPQLISFKAWCSNNVNVDAIGLKESYNKDEIITIEAIFNENLDESKEVPKLYLSFGEEDAKGKIESEIKGNKITYKYTIVDNDNGLMTIKGINGLVFDVYGNQTRVVKTNLEANTIIADTKSPILKEIQIINDGSKQDGTITIKEIYDENIYITNENVVNKVTNENCKRMFTLKVGDKTVEENEIIFIRVNKNEIEYKYKIKDGDNGNITVNVKEADETITDMAGNSIASTRENPPEIKNNNDADGEIIIDTTAPTVTLDAKIIDPSIKGTTPYYKAGERIEITATFSEKIKTGEKVKLPSIKVSFGDGTEKILEEGTINEEGTIVTYSYTIEDGDNGELKLSINGNEAQDLAGNGNEENTSVIETIIADTTVPYTLYTQASNDNAGIFITQNGQKINIEVKFSENIYNVENNSRIGLTTSAAPKIKIKFNTSNTEEWLVAKTIGEKSITYEYDKKEEDNGSISVLVLEGNAFDRAGNSINNTSYDNVDTTAPVLENIKITDINENKEEHSKTEANKISYYLNAGKKLNIEFTFDETLGKTQIPTLALKIGENTKEITSGTIEENKIIYEYTIEDGDNGNIIPESLGTVQDESGNKNNNPISENISTYMDEKSENLIADTIRPTVTIKLGNNTEKAMSKETENEYTFEISEALRQESFVEQDVSYINGTVKSTKYNEDKNLSNISLIKINDGEQIVFVRENVFEDIAGNKNEASNVLTTTIDSKAPEMRIKTNGGNFVKPTDTNAKLETILVVNEKLSKFEYIWSTSEQLPEEDWQTIDVKDIEIDSDITLSTNDVTVGTWYLYVKATDEFGNQTTGRSKAFIVNASLITISQNADDKTKVSITYGDYLTENRYAGFKDERTANLTSIEVSENGTIYAEATDTLGNKVYNTLEIANIEKLPTELLITSHKYVINLEEEYISRVQLNTTAGILKSNITTNAEEVKITDKNEREIADTDILTTGMKIKYKVGNIEKTLAIAIRGDVNGDGKVDFSDILQINKHRLEKITLKAEYVIAADANDDGEVDFSDILKINKYRLGKINVL